RTCTPVDVGYSAGAGYDQATGLGSIDAYNLVSSWTNRGVAVSRAAVNFTVTSSATSVTTAGSTDLTVTVTSANGVTPSGTVYFYAGTVLLGTATLGGSGGTATATLTVNGSQLTVGTVAISAQYSGDSAFASSAAALNLPVVAIQPGPPVIYGVAHG